MSIFVDRNLHSSLMDLFLIITAAILIIVGFLGSILPVLPGIPLSYLGIVLLHLTTLIDYSWSFLIGWGIVVVIIQIVDYFLPIWGTKKYGSSKYGTWGSTLGMVLGLFILPPWGMLIFPFVGAVMGELIAGKPSPIALKIGFGTFIGFLAGTVLKLLIGIVFIYIYVRDVWTIVATAF